MIWINCYHLKWIKKRHLKLFVPSCWLDNVQSETDTFLGVRHRVYILVFRCVIYISKAVLSDNRSGEWRMQICKHKPLPHPFLNRQGWINVFGWEMYDTVHFRVSTSDHWPLIKMQSKFDRLKNCLTHNSKILILR